MQDYDIIFMCLLLTRELCSILWLFFCSWTILKISMKYIIVLFFSVPPPLPLIISKFPSAYIQAPQVFYQFHLGHTPLKSFLTSNLNWAFYPRYTLAILSFSFTIILGPSLPLSWIGSTNFWISCLPLPWFSPLLL